MSIIIFIIVLGILIFVHELGHFILAKKTGMLVEEFAIGFPPRVVSFQKGETRYSIGLIPLGGFVKIHGEDYEEKIETTNNQKDKNYQRRFTNRPKWAQAVVLMAGIFFNLLLAWVFISIGFMSGLPVSVDQFEGEFIEETKLILIDVLPESPAEKAGLETGDIILSLDSGKTDLIKDFENTTMAEEFIAVHGGQEIEVLYERNEKSASLKIIPQEGVVEGKPAIGVSLGMIGTIKFPVGVALWEGLKTTCSLIVATAAGLFYFIKDLFIGEADLSQVAGPIGIIFLVGDVFNFGFIYLLSFVALISINLAVINLIPFPALDGGRLLFVLIETLKRSPIKAKTVNTLNLLGFVLLILLMVAVTFSDILKFF